MFDLTLRRGLLALILLSGLALLAAACGPRAAPPEATPLGLQPDVAEAAKEAVSEETGVPAEEIEIVQANQVEWTDTCLELGGEDEFCGQALTPGWRIMLQAGGEEYEVHTDLGADTVRIKR
jgi:hypothetical protein